MIVFDVIKSVINNFLSIIFFTTLAFLVYVVKYYYDYFTRPSKIPGPFPLPLIGNLHQLGSDLVASHQKLHKQYGDIYEFYTGNIHNVVISRPDLTKPVWESSTLKNAKFPMRSAHSVGVDELGLGTRGIVLNRDLDTWSYSRKFLIQSISTKPFLREAIKSVSQIGDDMFEYWKIMEEKGIQINIPEWMNALGTDLVINSATGQNITSRTDLFYKSCNMERKDSKQGIWNNGMDFTQAIHTYNGSMIFMILLAPFIRRNFPVLKDLNQKFLDNRDWIDKELENLISERRKEIDNTPSNQPLIPTILTLLLTTNTDRDLERMKTGKFDRPLKDSEIGSIIREVFTGGLDTTSNTLSFLFYYIANDRDIYMKMRNEVLEAYGTLDNPDITIVSFDKLKYMDAVIQESIRIFPTISSIGRAPVEEVELGGYTIKPETTVYTNNAILNHNPKYFKDPEKFNPDRFIIDKEPNDRYAFIPFGNGLRVCPGRAWGIVQMKTLLVKLVCKFDIKLADNADLKYLYATTTRPLNVNIHVKERN